MTTTAILNLLKEKVGVSLLKPTSVEAFGRKLSNIPGLQKDIKNYGTTYLVKLKKS